MSSVFSKDHDDIDNSSEVCDLVKNPHVLSDKEPTSKQTTDVPMAHTTGTDFKYHKELECITISGTNSQGSPWLEILDASTMTPNASVCDVASKGKPENDGSLQLLKTHDSSETQVNSDANVAPSIKSNALITLTDDQCGFLIDEENTFIDQVLNLSSISGLVADLEQTEIVVMQGDHSNTNNTLQIVTKDALSMNDQCYQLPVLAEGILCSNENGFKPPNGQLSYSDEMKVSKVEKRMDRPYGIHGSVNTDVLDELNHKAYVRRGKMAHSYVDPLSNANRPAPEDYNSIASSEPEDPTMCSTPILFARHHQQVRYCSKTSKGSETTDSLSLFTSQGNAVKANVYVSTDKDTGDYPMDQRNAQSINKRLFPSICTSLTTQKNSGSIAKSLTNSSDSPETTRVFIPSQDTPSSSLEQNVATLIHHCDKMDTRDHKDMQDQYDPGEKNVCRDIQSTNATSIGVVDMRSEHGPRYCQTFPTVSLSPLVSKCQENMSKDVMSAQTKCSLSLPNTGEACFGLATDHVQLDEQILSKSASDRRHPPIPDDISHMQPGLSGAMLKMDQLKKDNQHMTEPLWIGFGSPTVMFRLPTDFIAQTNSSLQNANICENVTQMHHNLPQNDGRAAGTPLPNQMDFTSTTDCATTSPSLDSPAKLSETSKPGIEIKRKQAPREGAQHRYDKSNYCVFCEKEIKSKIARHLLQCHLDQTEVYEVSLLAKNSEERVLRLEMLANEGNFKHNVDVLRGGSGDIVIARRSSNPVSTDVENYVPCEFCKKFMLKRLLYNHVKTCKVKLHKASSANDVPQGLDLNTEDDATNERNYIRRGEMLLRSVMGDTEDQTLQQLFSRMHDDEVTTVVKSDSLLMRYGSLELESLGPADVQKTKDIHRVSQRIRTLARLLTECRKVKPIPSFSSLLTCSNFDAVIRAAKAMSFEESTSYTLASKLGNYLGHIVLVKIGAAMRSGDAKKEGRGTRFQRSFGLWMEQASEQNCPEEEKS